jgi:acetyl-CoA acetyltransferase
MASRPYEDIVVAAPVTIPYRRYSTKGAHWFLARALAELIRVAGIRKDDVDGLALSSFTLAPDTAVGFTQHVGLSPRFLEHVPMGGASAILQLRRAARAVEAGDADIVACIAGDTNQVDSFRRMTANFSQFARDASYPYGSGGPNGSFALLTDYYMRVFGATAEDYGKLCVAQRRNAAANPLALFRKPLTLEQYLGARPIADPIRLFDCVMPCAGADGFLVMRKERAKRLSLPYARLLAAIERHNAYPEDPVQFRGGWALDREALYAQAGIAPQDVDLFEAYDDYPVIVLMQIEDLGFCRKGEGPDFLRRNSFTTDGTFPLNTGGGQLAMGQAGAAGGHLGLVEAVRQLTGAPLGAAVEKARFGLVSGFGMINYDRGLCSGAAILAAAGGKKGGKRGGSRK